MKNSRSILKTFFYFLAFLFLLGLLQYFFNIFDYFYKKEGFAQIQGDALIGIIVAGSVVLFAIISFFVYKRHKKRKTSDRDFHARREPPVSPKPYKPATTKITDLLGDTKEQLGRRGRKLQETEQNTVREKDAASDFLKSTEALLKGYKK